MITNKNDLIEILKKISYPGFSRDIVSFGIIKDISITNKKIKLSLSQPTNDNNILNKIKNEILQEISAIDSTLEIIIDFIPSNNSFRNKSSSNNKIKKIIAIASGKGGVGKSTIAINIASELSKSFNVGVLDLDIYGPSLPTLIGVKEVPKVRDNNILIPIEKFGMKFMSFGFLNSNDDPAIWRGPMVSKLTNQFFDNVDWGELDYLILDLPPGTGDIQLTLVQKIALNGAVIITTPQDLAHKDVQKGSDMFQKVNTPVLGVIENMSFFKLRGNVNSTSNLSSINISIDNKDVEVPIDNKGYFSVNIDIFKGKSGDKESGRLGIPLLGTIPLNPMISLLSDLGTPLVFSDSKSDLTDIFSKIVKKIILSGENN